MPIAVEPAPGTPAPPTPLPSGASSSTTAPPQAPIPTAPPRRTSRRTLWIAVGAIAAVIVVVVAALALSGVFSPASSPAVGTALSYTQAYPSAATAAASAPEGPWSFVAAVGVGVPSSTTESNVASIVGSGCTFTPTPGAPTTFTFPGTSSGAPAGELAAWVFIANDEVSNTSLLVLVTGSLAAAMGIATGGCLSEFSEFGTVTGSEVNSTTVAAEFNAAGGQSFLSGNSVLTRLAVLIGGYSETDGRPVWEIAYSTCAYTATSGTGTEMYGLYYADTGAQIEVSGANSVACGED